MVIRTRDPDDEIRRKDIHCRSQSGKQLFQIHVALHVTNGLNVHGPLHLTSGIITADVD